MGGIQMKLRTSQLLLNDDGKIIMGSGRMTAFSSPFFRSGITKPHKNFFGYCYSEVTISGDVVIR
jgi:hypothetical protein